MVLGGSRRIMVIQGFLKIHLDYGRPQHEPWAGKVGCMGVRVGFARRRTLPRTALASYPGSGNTWLRYLIQSSSGLFTGSVYIDRELASKGFYGENEIPECGCTIAVKTHGYCLGGLPAERTKEMDKFFGRGLLLLRNPFDTLIAYRNYLSAGHLGVAGPAAFKGADWSRFVHGQMEVWRAYALDWITLGRSVLVVHYEYLLEDPQRELLRILQFLRLRVEKQRLQCVMANLDGAFRRVTPDKISYRISDPYTKELHEVVEEGMRDVDLALVKHGWPGLPVHLYSYHYERNTTTTPTKDTRDTNSVFKGPINAIISTNNVIMGTSSVAQGSANNVAKFIKNDIVRETKLPIKSLNSIVQDNSIIIEDTRTTVKAPLDTRNKKGKVGRNVYQKKIDKRWKAKGKKERKINGNKIKFEDQNGVKVLKLSPWMKSR
ncbi:WSC domain-containing protein 1-like 1 [Homarus americanus]|uniref:WSC domain-containing protein 1-like 1 n=1 Tax=Homarus americanus TaxID=6706 RepID=A0A8J5JYP7_HOMAM|nr:WSC domain-containing protein 1-like 1 [Homarus americanus]